MSIPTILILLSPCEIFDYRLCFLLHPYFLFPRQRQQSSVSFLLLSFVKSSARHVAVYFCGQANTIALLALWTCSDKRQFYRFISCRFPKKHSNIFFLPSVNSIAQSSSWNLSRTNVRVNSICPGLIEVSQDPVSTPAPGFARHYFVPARCALGCLCARH